MERQSRGLVVAFRVDNLTIDDLPVKKAAEALAYVRAARRLGAADVAFASGAAGCDRVVRRLDWGARQGTDDASRRTSVLELPRLVLKGRRVVPRSSA